MESNDYVYVHVHVYGNVNIIGNVYNGNNETLLWKIWLDIILIFEAVINEWMH